MYDINTAPDHSQYIIRLKGQNTLRNPVSSIINWVSKTMQYETALYILPTESKIVPEN